MIISVSPQGADKEKKKENAERDERAKKVITCILAMQRFPILIVGDQTSSYILAMQLFPILIVGDQSMFSIVPLGLCFLKFL